jgi:hypothetical protein
MLQTISTSSVGDFSLRLRTAFHTHTALNFFILTFSYEHSHLFTRNSQLFKQCAYLIHFLSDKHVVLDVVLDL